MIKQLFKNSDIYKNQLNARLEKFKIPERYDIFKEGVVDAFFAINEFHPVNSVSYMVYDEEQEKSVEKVSQGRCYVKYVHNEYFDLDIMIVVYKDKIVIMAKDSVTIPTAFMMPINLTGKSLYNDEGKCEQEVLYELLLDCIDQYIESLQYLFTNEDKTVEEGDNDLEE